jgi:hypothetical protein
MEVSLVEVTSGESRGEVLSATELQGHRCAPAALFVAGDPLPAFGGKAPAIRGYRTGGLPTALDGPSELPGAEAALTGM